MDRIEKVWFDNNRIYVQLQNGNVFNRPLEAFPTLMSANSIEREDYEINRYGDALRWKKLDEDIHVSSFKETQEPNYDNEVTKVLNRFPWIDLKAIASSMNIHISVLMLYVYGMAKPSPERMAMLKDVLHNMGNSLLTA